MQDKIKIFYYLLKYKIVSYIEFRIIHRKFQWKQWAGKKLLSIDECQQSIYDAINSGTPYAVGRFGATEFRAVLAYTTSVIQNKPNSFAQERDNLKELSGFFSNDYDSFVKFCDLYIQAAMQIDVVGIWHEPMEEYILRKYLKNARLTELKNLEPYYAHNPWSKALENKRVLVVHPFSDSIRNQYRKRTEIWKDMDVLPEFTLITFQAIQTLCGEKDERFENWFEALEYMIQEISKINFDVAIIGCGAYGLPLASAIKEMGKQAIHLGGATQVLFGIKGKRWENIEFFKDKMNEYWVRPSQEEKPLNANQVEEGCYW